MLQSWTTVYRIHYVTMEGKGEGNGSVTVQEPLGSSSQPDKSTPELEKGSHTSRAQQYEDPNVSPSPMGSSGSALQQSSPEDIVVVLSQSVADGGNSHSLGQNAQCLRAPREQLHTSDATDEETPPTRTRTKRWEQKNIYGLSISYMIVFTSFIGLQNLQSSINSTGGLGLVSLSTLYVFFVISGFASPSILKVCGTKYSLVLGFLCHLQYTLANYYPSWYTLMPSSIVIGLASGPIWTAASSHLTQVAITVAPVLNKDQSYLIGKFTGTFFFFFQWSQIPGNLASSLIFFPYNWNQTENENSNETINTEQVGSCSYDGSTIDEKYLYILVSVYILFIVAGMVVLLVFVDNLPAKNAVSQPSGKKLDMYLKQPLLDLMSVLGSVRMILIAPMSVFTGLELSFMFGTFTEVYISDCFGTYQVGFTLMVLGATSAVMSMVYGRIMKYIPRFAIVLFGSTLNVSLLSFLLLWDRVPSYVAIYTFVVVWGLADAVWNTVTTSLTGILFPTCSNAAYSAVRIWVALGFTLGFASAKLMSVQACLWILLAAVLLAVLCNLIVEFTTQPKTSLLPCFKAKQMDDLDPKKKSPSAERYIHGDAITQNNTGVLIRSHKETNTLPACDEHRHAPKNMSTFECDSLDGTFPSWSAESVPYV